jgi:hypothetical protein
MLMLGGEEQWGNRLLTRLEEPSETIIPGGQSPLPLLLRDGSERQVQQRPRAPPSLGHEELASRRFWYD